MGVYEVGLVFQGCNSLGQHNDCNSDEVHIWVSSHSVEEISVFMTQLDAALAKFAGVTDGTQLKVFKRLVARPTMEAAPAADSDEEVRRDACWVSVMNAMHIHRLIRRPEHAGSHQYTCCHRPCQ